MNPVTFYFYLPHVDAACTVAGQLLKSGCVAAMIAPSRSPRMGPPVRPWLVKGLRLARYPESFQRGLDRLAAQHDGQYDGWSHDEARPDE